MTETELTPKQTALIEDITADSELYYDTWKFPMSYQMLSTQYGSRIKKLFDSNMQSFRKNASIIISITPRGRKVVFPVVIADALRKAGDFELALARCDENAHRTGYRHKSNA